MAVKIFNDRATFLLKAEDGEKLKVPPMGFMDVPEKFTGDITFKMAVKAGVIKVFETTAQGEALERQAYEPAQAEPEEQPEAAAKKGQPRKPAKGDSK